MQEKTSALAANAGTRTLRYKVVGMDCPSCVSKVETALLRVPGADDIGLNYHSQVLRLTLDEATTPRSKLEDTIRTLGYRVEPLGDLRIIADDAARGADEASASEERPWWSTPKGKVTILIGILVAAGYLASWLAPALEDHALVPAALVGLAVFGRRAVALVRAGSPFSIEMLMSVATVSALFMGEAAVAAAKVLLFAVGELLEGVAAGTAR
ncbi:cation transporter, partial [Azospirillum rugosum]|uniref:cation transporter n=1 Tax=Azospirillum rugosum TaxID=416170 RepID=UPI0036202362